MTDLADVLAPFITILFNKSVSDGYFPLAFRSAEITPILKKNSLDPAVVSNYRPIFNLPYLSKLLERAIKSQRLAHLDGNGSQPECQSAYRKSHSTESALLKISSDALAAADVDMLTLMGFLDLSAAFDCVDHEIFLRRAEVSFGILENASCWIRSYLDGRTQCLRYNGSVSISSTIVSGVPQGSVLGPIFFLLYTSDVFDIALLQGFRIHGYADDLQLYQHCLPSDVDSLNTRFIGCIEAIQGWMSRNRLKFNASKTEVMWLGSSRRIVNVSFPVVTLSGCVVPLAASVRSLGVIIDPALSFSRHISKLACSCYYQLRQLRSIRKSLTTDSCHSLVRALIVSRLDYCNSLLGDIPKYLLDQLNGVLRAAARLILQRPRTDHITDAMCRQLHWLDAPARIQFKLCVFAFKYLNNLAPPYLSTCCTPVASVSGRSMLRSAAAGELVYQPTVLPRSVDGRLRSLAPPHGTRFRLNCTAPGSACAFSRNSSKLFCSRA